MINPYYYRCEVERVVDGDTIDVHIDLGFKVILRKQRLRLAGIDTPESRTRNKAEKNRLAEQSREGYREK